MRADAARHGWPCKSPRLRSLTTIRREHGWSNWPLWGDSTHIVQAVAKALGVAEQVGKDLAETLIERVEQRRQLLVLDNAEHVLDACADWRNACCGVARAWSCW